MSDHSGNGTAAAGAAAPPTAAAASGGGAAFNFGGAIARAVSVTRRAIPNPMAGVRLDLVTSRIPRVKLSGSFGHLFSKPKRHGDANSLSAQLAAAAGDRPALDDDDDEQPLDLEIVDSVFFNPTYEAGLAELTKFPQTMDDETLLAELRKTETTRSLQERAVNAALKQSLLDRSDVFLRGIEQVREVDEDLSGTARQCQEARSRLTVAKKAFVEQSLHVLAYKRRRAHLKRLLSTLEVLNTVRNHDLRMTAMIGSGRLAESAKMAEKMHLEMFGKRDLVQQLAGARHLVLRAKGIVENPRQLLDAANGTIDRVVLRGMWNETAFESALTGYVSLNALQDLESYIAHVGLLRVRNAFLVPLGNLVVVVSDNQQVPTVPTAIGPAPTAAFQPPAATYAVPASDTADQGDSRIAGAFTLIPPKQHRVICLQAFQQVAEVLAMFLVMRDPPAVVDNDVRTAYQIVKRVAEAIIGPRVLQLAGLLMHASPKPPDFNEGLHSFFVASMLIDSVKVLGVAKETLIAARDDIVTLAESWIHGTYVQRRAMMLFESMQDMESWLPNPGIPVNDLRSISELQPAHWKDQHKWTQQKVLAMADVLRNGGTPAAFVVPPQSSSSSASVPASGLAGQRPNAAAPSLQGYGMLSPQDSLQTNPFFDPRIAEVHDESADIAVASLGGSWSSPPDVFLIPTPVAEPPLPHGHRVYHGTTLLSSSAVVANTVFEMLCRVLPRVPTLAPSVLSWAEELASTYLYLAAHSFVRTSSEVAIEAAKELSDEAKACLRSMRLATVSSVPHLQAVPLPRFWDVGSIFSKTESQYGFRCRLFALDAALPLIRAVEAAVSACALIIPQSTRESHDSWTRLAHRTAMELLHLACHRLTSATFPLDDVTSSAKETRLDPRAGGERSAFTLRVVGPAVQQFCDLRRRLADREDEVGAAPPAADTTTGAAAQPSVAASASSPPRRPPLVPPAVDCWVARHLEANVIWAVQRGFAQNKTFKGDQGTLQMSIDVQQVHQIFRNVFPGAVALREQYASALINTGYIPDVRGRLEWVSLNKRMYFLDVLLGHFGKEMTSRDQRRELERLLEAHDDDDVVRVFIQHGARWPPPQAVAPLPPPPAATPSANRPIAQH